MNFDVCAAACIAEIKPEVPPNTCLAGLSACCGARRYILFPFFSFTEKKYSTYAPPGLTISRLAIIDEKTYSEKGKTASGIIQLIS